MPVIGGGNRKDLRPHLRPLEHRSVGTLGNHRRQFEALNIPNPQPGRFYVHVRSAEGPLRKKLNEGYRFIRDEDPEARTFEPEEIPLSMRGKMDSLQAFGDVVLMYAPEEVKRRKQKALVERNAASLRGAEQSFLEQGVKVAAEVGSAAGSNPLFYVNTKRGHGYRVSEEER